MQGCSSDWLWSSRPLKLSSNKFRSRFSFTQSAFRYIESHSFDVNLPPSSHSMLPCASAGAPLLHSCGHLCPVPLLPTPSAADDHGLQGDGLNMDDPYPRFTAINAFEHGLMMVFLTEAVQRSFSEAGFLLLSIPEHFFPRDISPKNSLHLPSPLVGHILKVTNSLCRMYSLMWYSMCT